MHIPQQALGYSLVHYKLQIAETFDTLTLAKTPELYYVIFVTRMKIWVQNFTPKTRKSRLFVFTTKHVNPLLFGLTAEVSGVKLPQLNGFF